MVFKVIIHEAEEGGFWAEVPGFPGCVTEADTLEELRSNLADAISGYLSALNNSEITDGLQISEIAV
ncbi:HicB family protein [Armatimonadetes bacterium Uphvl-Ar1]|nr:HicB family protein [Armatimonadetes bacterium Uphvl-Ar1]